MRRFLYDTNVFVYALGGPSPYREPCRAIVEKAAAGRLDGEASADLVQEFLHQRMRQVGDRALAAAAARRIPLLCRLHDVKASDLTLALWLFETHERVTARDATFAAVALNRGLDAILSADRDFDEIPGLERIDPRDEARVHTLLGEAA
ncbi:MAG: type II toxin-antitoxin system VapC family toxin [Conexibacter sp.]